MILHFDREQLQRLVSITKAAKEYRPSYAQVFDPKYRKDGREPSLDEEITLDDIDPAKLKPALLLVGDQGVYFMSNAKLDLPKGQRHDVAYAVEANPNEVPFDDWWDAKNRSFGGDDGVEVIELETIEQWLARGKGEYVQLDLEPDRFAFL